MISILAGKVVSEILSDIFVDGCPTVAEYVTKEEDATENDAKDLIQPNEEWHLKHVKESKYLLQIRKCDDLNCCSSKRSSLFRVIKDGFLPPPIPIQHTETGLCYKESSTELSNENTTDQYLSLFQNLMMGSDMLPQIAHQTYPLEIPYDYSCPSLNSTLSETTCSISGRYFASKSSFATYSQSINHQQSLNLIKPEKLLVRRGDDILCCINNSLNFNEYMWFKLDELDLSGICIEDIPETVIKSGIKVYNEIERTALWKEF